MVGTGASLAFKETPKPVRCAFENAHGGSYGHSSAHRRDGHSDRGINIRA